MTADGFTLGRWLVSNAKMILSKIKTASDKFITDLLEFTTSKRFLTIPFCAIEDTIHVK